MTDTILLEKVIQESGFKKSYLAKRIGISAFALAKKIRNENEFKSTEIAELCDVLNIASLEEKERIFFAKKVDL